MLNSYVGINYMTCVVVRYRVHNKLWSLSRPYLNLAVPFLGGLFSHTYLYTTINNTILSQLSSSQLLFNQDMNENLLICLFLYNITIVWWHVYKLQMSVEGLPLCATFIMCLYHYLLDQCNLNMFITFYN